MALDIAGNVDDPELLPGMLMMLLSEVPAEPLLGAKPQQIGSVLGLTSLGYLLSRQDHAETLRRMLSAGDGVVLLRITGDLDRHHANVEIFEDWEGYQRFLVPILRRGKLQKGDGSTLL
ncbi:hypothetical protein [Cupriavidus metallidurans]|uniref:hypothetical protein n=2 Tax=Burkholderiaceae TaxID=119060 RepID=UPI0007C6DC15|nr:hypothetical protein [Cupriavidus metallidurans]